jgi:hypothetical protein
MSDPHLKVKKILANYMSNCSKMSSWTENKFEITNVEICDAIIVKIILKICLNNKYFNLFFTLFKKYNLRTIIKTNRSSEEYFNLNGNKKLLILDFNKNIPKKKYY